jgi:hypothetical protein
LAVTAFWFGLGMSNMLNAAIDWDTDTVKVTLHTSAMTPNQDTWDFYDDVTNELATAGGYTAGGLSLTNKTRTYDTATNEVRLDADDPSWTSATFTCRYAVFRKARGGAASADELIGYINFGADETVASGTFTIVLDATGAFKVTVS